MDRIENKLFPEISQTEVIKKDTFKIERFYNVNFKIRVILGRKYLTIEEIDNLKVNDVIELGKDVASMLKVYINGVPICYGEIVIFDDIFGIRITELRKEKINSECYLKDLDYSLEKAKYLKKTKEINKNRFYNVQIDLRIEIGMATCSLKEIIGFDVGTIIELNKNINEPIIAYGNNIPIFKGKVVFLTENELFGFQIEKIIE